MKNILFKYCMVAAIIVIGAVFPAHALTVIVEGQVVDTTNKAMIGATVLIIVTDRLEGGAIRNGIAARSGAVTRSSVSTRSGTATDRDGHFRIKITNSPTEQYSLRVSSIGYETRTLPLSGSMSDLAIVLRPTDAISELSPITVRTLNDNRPSQTISNHEQIRARARQSLISTNPVASVREPSVAVQGSSLSSRLRINGTDPTYYLNGISLGTNPDHYGMFSVIPSTVIDKVAIHAHGTDASHGRPSVIEMSALIPADKSGKSRVDVSAFEATATYAGRIGENFVVASYRESVLDKLIKQIDAGADRVAIPPTSFRDLFVSTGRRLSGTIRLAIDQYHVRDQLSFNTAEATGSAVGIETDQNSTESFVSARLTGLYDHSMFDLSLAIRSLNENYAAHTDGTTNGLQLDLRSERQTWLAGQQVTILMGNNKLALGNQLKVNSRNSINLKQTNWNFLSPFSGTDNPYFYQAALDKEFGSYSSSRSDFDNATYFSVEHSGKHMKLTAGIRNEYFRSLASRWNPTARLAADLSLGDQTRLRFFAGTFAEHPTTKTLESYQVLINSSLEQLEPIRTGLVSATVSHGALDLTLFAKEINSIPSPTPDFNKVDNVSYKIAPSFITMRSTGSAYFRGLTTSLTFDRLLAGNLDLFASYAYGHANQGNSNITVPYDMDSPHRMVLAADFRASTRLMFAAQLNVRSGYPYSPLRGPATLSSPETYSSDYYRHLLSEENSLRFPTHMSLNVHAKLNFGRAEAFLTVANITNRANPIVSAASGLIHDAGVTPSLGFSYEF